MNRLTTQKRVQVLGALVEGNSIRSTVRMTGAAKNTVVNLLRPLEAKRRPRRSRRQRQVRNSKKPL